MTLTPSQQRAVKVLGPIFAGKSHSYTEACMIGWAGTGKTYTLGILAKIAQEIPDANGEKREWGIGGHEKYECEGRQWATFPRVLFIAPTHKAARQIEKSMRSAGVGLDVHTIHRVVGVRPERREGEEVWQQDPSAELLIGDHTRLIIIDELSMIEQSLLDMAREAMAGTGAIVGVGDPAQLPPPGGGGLCDLFQCENVIKLEEVVRHGGVVLSLATKTRQLRGGRPRFYPGSGGGSEIKTYSSCLAWKNAAIKACVENERIGNYDASRVLCFTNRSADALNAEIHEAIYGKDAPPFIRYQPVVTHGPVIPPPEEPGIKAGFPLCHGTTELLIEELTPMSGNFRGDELDFMPDIVWRYWEVVAVPIGESKQITFYVLHPSQVKQWISCWRLISNAARKAKANGDKESASYFWRIFWYRRDQFAKVTPIWAMTIHKSQGSTFENVYIHQDIDWTSDMIYQKKALLRWHHKSRKRNSRQRRPLT